MTRIEDIGKSELAEVERLHRRLELMQAVFVIMGGVSVSIGLIFVVPMILRSGLGG